MLELEIIENLDLLNTNSISQGPPPRRAKLLSVIL